MFSGYAAVDRSSFALLLTLGALLLSVARCGKGPQAQHSVALSDKPAVVSSTRTAAEPEVEAGTPQRAPIAASETPAAAASSQVIEAVGSQLLLFAVNGSTLVPLFCTDPLGTPVSLFRCPQLVPVGSQVALSNGSTGTVRGPIGVRCGRGEVDPFPALLFTAEASTSTWAAFPVSARDRVLKAGATERLNSEELQGARRSIAPLVVATVETHADLDGDGVVDAVVSVRAPS